MKPPFVLYIRPRIVAEESGKRSRVKLSDLPDNMRSLLSLVAKLIVTDIHKNGMLSESPAEPARPRSAKSRKLLVRVVMRGNKLTRKGWKKRPFRRRKAS